MRNTSAAGSAGSCRNSRKGVFVYIGRNVGIPVSLASSHCPRDASESDRPGRQGVGTTFLVKRIVFGFLGRPIPPLAPFRVEFRESSRVSKREWERPALWIGGIEQTTESLELRSIMLGGCKSDRFRTGIFKRANADPFGM